MAQSSIIHEESVILGIDPGTSVTGYGVIALRQGRTSPLDYGCIRPPSKLKLSERYLILFRGMEELLKRFKPTAVVVESQFLKHNFQSALKVGMARGVVVGVAKNLGVPVYCYSPAEAKNSVVGNGRASKEQVAGMIARLLAIQIKQLPLDASDALALALCHAARKNQWEEFEF